MFNSQSSINSHWSIQSKFKIIYLSKKNSLPRRKWITIVPRERALELPQQFICAYTIEASRQREELWFDFVNFVQRDHDLDSGRKRESIPSRCCGSSSPAQQDALWFIAPGTWRLAEFSLFGWKKFLLSNFQHQTHQAIEKLANCLYGPFLWFMLKGWVVYSLFACWRL